MKAVIISNNICIGCDLCVDLCPEVFRITDFIPEVITTDEKYLKCIKDAINFCPVNAIYIE